MLFPDQIPTPEGYVPALWRDTIPGMEVYLKGLRHLPGGKVGPAAHGPYKVVERFWLVDAGGVRVNEISERLLLKDTLTPPKVSRPPWWRRAWNRMVCSH